MKTMQLVKLGHKSISEHKLRSIFTIIVLGALFSVLVFLVTLIQGLENNMLAAGFMATDGKALVKVSVCGGMYNARVPVLDENDDEVLDENGDLVYQIMPTCKEPKIYDKQIQEEVKSYNGEQIGAVITYVSKETGNQVSVIPERAAKYIKTKGTYYAPEGKVPVVTSMDSKYDTTGFFELDETKYYNLGYYPGYENGIRTAKRRDEFNLIDNYINVGHDYTYMYLVMDASSTVLDFLIANNYEMSTYEPLVAFDDSDKAFEFYSKKKKDEADCELANYTNCMASPLVDEVLTGNLKTREFYNSDFESLKILLVVLIVVATVIIFFSFLRIISDDTKSIALYRSLGATGKDVFLIYLFELFEFSVLTIIFAFSVGIIGDMIVSNMYHGALLESMEKFFGYSVELGPLIGFNIIHLYIILSILAIAPVCSLLTLNQLSMKNVAKRLKKG